jgi:uncharacterized protein
MTPAERQLIEGLFDRMQRVEPVDKDRGAERLIQEAVREIPDAPYLLVQSVLVQEEALRKADARIRQLESQSADEPAKSFLGGSTPSRSSVPVTGSRPVAPPAAEPVQPESGRGSFLASALTTAASVAGGMLLADGIRGLFGGHTGAAASSTDQAALDKAQDDAQDASDDADEARKELAADDAASDDAQDQYEDRGDDWGGDSGIDT